MFFIAEFLHNFMLLENTRINATSKMNGNEILHIIFGRRIKCIATILYCGRFSTSMQEIELTGITLFHFANKLTFH